MKKYLEVFSGTYEDILQKIEASIKNENKLFIVPMSPPLVTIALRDKEFCKIVCKADIRTPDGIGMILASKLFGKNVKERITGANLTIRLARLAANKKWKLFFLGAAPGVAEKAKKKLLRKYKALQIKTYSPPFGEFSQEENKKITKMINNFKTNILFVAFGAPKQEKWIEKHKNYLNAQVFLPVGGTFDFIAGEINRAPEVIQKFGFEWLHRICIQPQRLLRLPDALMFFPHVAKEFILDKILKQSDCDCC